MTPFSYKSRLKLAGLPHHKTIEDYDTGFQPGLDPKRISELASLAFIKKQVSALILGPPGVGKTHLAVGIAMKALNAGYLVRYTTLDDLITDLNTASQQGKLKTKLAQYLRPHLLAIDEVGYLTGVFVEPS